MTASMEFTGIAFFIFITSAVVAGHIACGVVSALWRMDWINADPSDELEEASLIETPENLHIEYQALVTATAAQLIETEKQHEKEVCDWELNLISIHQKIDIRQKELLAIGDKIETREKQLADLHLRWVENCNTVDSLTERLRETKSQHEGLLIAVEVRKQQLQKLDKEKRDRDIRSEFVAVCNIERSADFDSYKRQVAVITQQLETLQSHISQNRETWANQEKTIAAHREEIVGLNLTIAEKRAVADRLNQRCRDEQANLDMTRAEHSHYWNKFTEATQEHQRITAKLSKVDRNPCSEVTLKSQAPQAEMDQVALLAFRHLSSQTTDSLRREMEQLAKAKMEHETLKAAQSELQTLNQAVQDQWKVHAANHKDKLRESIAHVVPVDADVLLRLKDLAAVNSELQTKRTELEVVLNQWNTAKIQLERAEDARKRVVGERERLIDANDVVRRDSNKHAAQLACDIKAIENAKEWKASLEKEIVELEQRNGI